jgi:hypothetical protein
MLQAKKSVTNVTSFLDFVTKLGGDFVVFC